MIGTSRAGAWMLGTCTDDVGRASANVASPLCANIPNRKMSTSPNSTNTPAAMYRRLTVIGLRALVTVASAVIRSTPSPLLPARWPGPARSRNTARISGGAATNKTIRPSMTSVISTGTEVAACITVLPASSAPNSSAASTTPSGLARPSRATVMPSMP